MNIAEEIARQVEQLPPAAQVKVLQYAASVSKGTPTGEKGSNLLQFANLLDSASAREMQEAIESECERVDARDW
jgi:hypothetical protein